MLSGEDLRRRAGAIDSALLDLFIEARVFDSASSVSRSVTQTASTAGANA